jgi:hypothetical protein
MIQLISVAEFRAVRSMMPFVLVALLCSQARADPQQCREAVKAYKSARRDVSEALRSYVDCLSNSRGHEDCASEFSRLQTAQIDFETAVSGYEQDCN